MTDSDEATIDANVTRYNVARLRVGLLLIPLAVIATVLARRSLTLLPLSLAFAIQGIGLALLLSGMKRFGWRPLRFDGGVVTVGSTEIRIERIKVHSWTLVDGVARLYGVKVSYKLRARNGAEQALGALLRSQFGAPPKLERRGSKQARLLALGVGLSGLVISAIAIATNSPLLAILGAPAFLLGIATFGALSQRAAL